MHANNAWWRDVKNYKSKDVPWRMKCRRMVEHVHRAFYSGSESWSWSQKTLDRITGWETKAMSRFSTTKKKKMRLDLTITQKLAGLSGKCG